MHKKLSILVVDDEAPLADIYKNFLEKMDAVVTYCDHPQKAWQAIDKEEFNLIITDLKMPVISGDEFISIVRASKLNAHTPIILSSAFINKLVVTEISRESKVYFLSKPFDSKTLLEMVGKAVALKKTEASAVDTIKEKWIDSIGKTLEKISSDKVVTATIFKFEKWNFESIALQFFVRSGEEFLLVNLLMKQKTFLKIAGKIQGTQYNEIEPENLIVWEELLHSAFKGTSKVSFSSVLSQDIIVHPDRTTIFHKINSSLGEILVYLQ
jgi:CheY-like chemotaxis protein